MKLYEQFQAKGFHTSIATTFSLDFEAYEQIVLARLRGAGCRNNLVASDSRMLTHALGGASALPRHAGTQYAVTGAAASGVFHPKLFLQLGKDHGRLIIGSANITPAGLAGNLELVSALSCGNESSGEQQLIASAWSYMAGLFDDQQQGVAEQLGRAQARTPWLGTATATEGIVSLADDTPAALLTDGTNTGIGARFADLIDGPVTRLIVISPYWDHDLAALAHLTDRLAPAETAVVIDPETREFPKDAASKIDNLKLVDRGSFREGRFVHAKALIAETPEADHLLMGSANCTRAALGTAAFAGANAETCLYRRLPPGSMTERLGLTAVLSDGQRIDPDTLAAPEQNDPLPLERLSQQTPGTFELHGDTLRWNPANTVENPDACRITLLNRRAHPVTGTLSLLSRASQERRYRINHEAKACAFAQVAFADGTLAPPAIITWIDALKFETRPHHSSKLQNRLEALEEETEASVALLDILTDLQNLEQAADGKAPLSVLGATQSAAADAGDRQYKVMSYEEFIAGRRPYGASQDAGYNSLAGSNASIVRSVLNGIVGLQRADDFRADDEDDGPGVDLSTGDETNNPEGAVDAGQEFGNGDIRDATPEPDEETVRRRARQRRDTQDQIVNATQKFERYLREQRDNNSALTGYDVIRLRALLMVLSTAASPKDRRTMAVQPTSSLRVLPVEGDTNCWPAVMGRLLFVMFGGKRPAIRQLYLANELDQVPDDFSESWGTCYWCFQACLQAPASTSQRRWIQSHIKPLAKNAFTLTLPSTVELLSEEVMSVIDKMSERYAGALHLDSKKIRNGHKDLVTKTFDSDNFA